MGNIQKNDMYQETLIKYMQSTLFFDKIEIVLRQHQSLDIVNCCFDILAYLQDYGISYLVEALRRTKILTVLEELDLPGG